MIIYALIWYFSEGILKMKSRTQRGLFTHKVTPDSGSPNLKIALVDDGLAIRMILEHYLDSYQVYTFDSEESAIKGILAADDPFDIVVTDIHMKTQYAGITPQGRKKNTFCVADCLT